MSPVCRGTPPEFPARCRPRPPDGSLDEETKFHEEAPFRKGSPPTTRNGPGLGAGRFRAGRHHQTAGFERAPQFLDRDGAGDGVDRLFRHLGGEREAGAGPRVTSSCIRARAQYRRDAAEGGAGDEGRARASRRRAGRPRGDVMEARFDLPAVARQGDPQLQPRQAVAAGAGLGAGSLEWTMPRRRSSN